MRIFFNRSNIWGELRMTRTAFDKISAVIPTYNSSQFIHNTIISLVNQTRELKEIIVVDDHSDDDTCNIVRSLSQTYHNVFLYQLNQNYGSSTARNKGIELAQSEWVLLMDHDDLADPQLLAKEWDCLIKLEAEQPDSWVLIHSAYQQIDIGNRIISEPIRWQQVGKKEILGYEFIRNRIITNSGVLLHKPSVLQVGGYDPELKYSQDWDLWLRLAQIGGFGYVDEPLIKVRRYQNNTSSNVRSFQTDELNILRKYSTDFIENAIYCRNLPEIQNKSDFVSVMFRLGFWEKGLAILKSIHDFEAHPTVYFLEGLYYLNFKQYQQAKILFEKTINLAPTHAAALNNLGVILAFERMNSEANKLFLQALALNPEYRDARRNLDILQNQGWIEAEQANFTWRELRSVLLVYNP